MTHLARCLLLQREGKWQIWRGCGNRAAPNPTYLLRLKQAFCASTEVALLAKRRDVIALSADASQDHVLRSCSQNCFGMSSIKLVEQTSS
mmetsp:Transcript_62099/g.171736  ORF Transcript_62099/g.171736 Transcript_62099/m.171736 type:complete len:90 (+) Transcript_62099:181-450(+)